jgi:hypothetical protein
MSVRPKAYLEVIGETHFESILKEIHDFRDRTSFEFRQVTNTQQHPHILHQFRQGKYQFNQGIPRGTLNSPLGKFNTCLQSGKHSRLEFLFAFPNNPTADFPHDSTTWIMCRAKTTSIFWEEGKYLTSCSNPCMICRSYPCHPPTHPVTPFPRPLSIIQSSNT